MKKLLILSIFTILGLTSQAQTASTEKSIPANGDTIVTITKVYHLKVNDNLVDSTITESFVKHRKVTQNDLLIEAMLEFLQDSKKKPISYNSYYAPPLPPVQYENRRFNNSNRN